MMNVCVHHIFLFGRIHKTEEATFCSLSLVQTLYIRRVCSLYISVRLVNITRHTRTHTHKPFLLTEKMLNYSDRI